MPYHQFKSENGEAYGSFEVFQLTAEEIAERDEDLCYEYMRRHEFRLATMNSRVRSDMLDQIVREEGIKGGWFWQACFPGCMPDGDPMGPFATAAEAIADAQDN